jgi:hypothetical protein
MSGVVEGVIGMVVVAGAVRMTWRALTQSNTQQSKATARGRVARDERRGRSMRRSAVAASAAAEDAWQASRRRASDRRTSRDRHVDGLPHSARQAMREREQRARAERERLERSFEEQRGRQQREFEERCAAVEDDIRVAEDRFDARLEQLRDTVDSRFATERQNWSRTLADHRAEVDRVIELQRAGLQGQIADLQQRVANEAAAADEWLQAVAAEAEFIATNYRHDFFCPGELAEIQARLAVARGNHAQGIHQAAVALAQESTLHATALHERLELLTDRWDAARALAISSLRSGIGVLDALKSFQLSDVIITPDDQPAQSVPGHEIDVNFWTEGAWSARRAALEADLARIEDDTTTATLDELEALQAAGETAAAEAEALVATAKYAAMASIMRAELQERFAVKLAESGYSVEDNVWAGNDERDENHLFLRGATGDRISIVLSPTREGCSIGNSMQVNFHDPSPSPNEAARHEHVTAITDVLSEVYELPSGNLTIPCVPGTENDPNAPAERFDVAKVRQRRRKAPHAQSG